MLSSTDAIEAYREIARPAMDVFLEWCQCVEGG